MLIHVYTSVPYNITEIIRGREFYSLLTALLTIMAL